MSERCNYCFLKSDCNTQDLASDFDDGYGSDLMGNESDRTRLASMNELEREMELAERAENRDKELERRRTARMLKQQQHKAAQVNSPSKLLTVQLHSSLDLREMLSSLTVRLISCVYFDRTEITTLSLQAGNMRSSTRQKEVDSAKQSAMAELVAAKNARARRSSQGNRRRRYISLLHCQLIFTHELEVSSNSRIAIRKQVKFRLCL